MTAAFSPMMVEALAIVGLVSSIVQFVDFSSKIVHRLNEFHSSLDEVPKSFRDIKIELPLLVDTIERTKKQTEDGHFSKDTQEAIWSVVKGCQSQVEQLDDVLEETLPSKGDSSWRRGKKALSSIAQEKKIQQITTTFRNYVQTLTYHQATGSSIGTRQTSFFGENADLYGIDDNRKRIHRWLSAPDPWFNYNKALRERQAGTGTWFINSKQYTNWKTNSGSFLWLHGIPGCGKTILSSTIIEDVLYHCHHDPTMVVIYFYFDFNDVEKQQYEKMVRSLIMQLSLRYKSTPRVLATLFSSCTDGERQPTSDALLTTLQQMIREFDGIFVILDALDECEERQELLEDISKIIGWNTEKLHILATSRREKDIEESLDSLINGQGKICIQSTLVSDDIRVYIQKRLQSDQNLKRWRGKPEVQQEIETKLMGKADGMFRWAVCQLDALGRCLNLRKLREALERLPDTLDGTYDRILCAIHKEYSQDAFKILQWLVYSARPLRIGEIVDAIAVYGDGGPRFDPESRLPDPQDILEICSSLVTIAGVEIKLAHFSVKEYLVSERIQNGPARQYSIQEIPANASIGEICLAYLLQFDKANCLTRQTTEEYPLARYAAEYWTQHARAAEGDAETIHQLIIQLFWSKRDAYVNWVRLFDLDEPWQGPEITKGLEKVAPPLYYASLAGLIESVRLLLEKGADANTQGGRYGNALQAASYKGHDQVVQRLLEKGAESNAQGGWYGNALQAASYGGHDQVVQRLLEKGAEANAQGGWYTNALQAASYGGHDQVVQRLLEKGAEANAQGGEYGNALQAASYGGHDQVVQRLLEKGANANALQAASYGGHDQVVRRLLEKGANVNAQGGWYGNALQAASAGGHDQVVRRLLEKGANVNAQGGEYSNALRAASYGGHDQVVQRLLEKGADANTQGGRYGNALQAASAGGHDQVVQRLLEKGADANAQGGRYGNALQAASYGGHDQVVRRLLEKGADANAQGGRYGNALHAASAGGHDQVVQRLLEKGADASAQGGWYGNALQAASYKGHDQVVQRLLEKGAESNAQGGWYGNALQAASYGGHDQVVQRLLEKGANVNAQGGWHGNALQAASYKGHDQVVRRLLEKGAVANAPGG